LYETPPPAVVVPPSLAGNLEGLGKGAGRAATRPEQFLSVGKHAPLGPLPLPAGWLMPPKLLEPLVCARVEVEVRVFAPEPICPGPVPILPLVPLVELVPVPETPEPVFPGPVPILPLVPLVELVPVPVLIDPAFSVLPVPDWPTFPSFVTPAFFVEVLPDPDLLVPIFPL